MDAAHAPGELGQTHDLVVVGASAGGVETLKAIVAGFPAGFPAAICVVLHIAPGTPSALAHILQRAGPLACSAASDGDELRTGEILVAPPDRHLVIEDGRVRLTVGPRENGHRPAVDVLFRSAAAARDSGVVGVVLSGTRDDGTAGLAAIKASGGAAVVQDPEEALYGGMPSNALAHVEVDAVVPSAQIAETVDAMVRGDELPLIGDPRQTKQQEQHGEDRLISVCPECGGVLTERVHAGMVQWECHVGHRYSPTSLVDAQGNGVEAALWTAVRMLRDRSALLDRMAAHADSREQPRTARRFRSQSQDASDQAELVLGVLSQAAATALQTAPEERDEPSVASEGTG